MAHSFKRNIVGRAVASDLFAADDQYDFSQVDRPKKKPSFPQRTSDLKQISSLEMARQRQQSRPGSANRLGAELQNRPRHGQPPPSKIHRPWKNHSSPATPIRSPSWNVRHNNTRSACESESAPDAATTAADPIDLCESGEDTDKGEEAKDDVGGKKRTSPQNVKENAKSSESEVAPQLPLVDTQAPKNPPAKRAKLCDDTTANMQTTRLTPLGTIDLSIDDEKATVHARAQMDTLGSVPRKMGGRTKFLPANHSQGFEKLTVPKLKQCDTRPKNRTAMSRIEDSLIKGSELSSSPKPSRDTSKEIMEKVQEVASATSMYDGSCRSIRSPVVERSSEPEESRLWHRNTFSLKKINSYPKKMKRHGKPIEIGQSFSRHDQKRIPSPRQNTCIDYSHDGTQNDDTRRLTRASARLDEPSSGGTQVRRSSQSQGKIPPETIEILTSDEEEDPNVSKFDFVRILVDGQLKSDSNCNLVFDNESKVIRISYKSGKKVRGYVISEQDIMECCYYLSPLPQHGDGDGGSNEEMSVLMELETYAILSLTVNSHVFHQEVTSPRKDTESEGKRILIQFEEEEEFQDLLVSMSDAGLTLEAVGKDAVDLPTLAKEAEKLRMCRSSVSRTRRKNPFSSGKAKDDILLVYPFAEDRSKIEAAVQTLNIFSTQRDSKDLDDSAQTHFSANPIEFHQRSHYITVRVKDYDRLEPEVWLNDSLIDFFMLWISRDICNIHASDVHFFTSHFYSTLARKGSKGVTSWTAKKNIDIFKKKLIFIPINKSMHWSLCVVINPGEIINYYSKQEPSSKMPCLICLDSLQMHCPLGTKRNIMRWLNSEWLRLRSTTEGTGPFDDQSLQVFTPKVPLQNNGSDCGVFVCRYSLGLYNLRHLDFTEQDIFAGKKPKDNRRGKEGFLDIITRGDEFKFNVRDIKKMRREFQKLIEHLSKLYSQWQKKQKRSIDAAKKECRKDWTREVAGRSNESIDEKKIKTSSSAGLKERNEKTETLVETPFQAILTSIGHPAFNGRLASCETNLNASLPSVDRTISHVSDHGKCDASSSLTLPPVYARVRRCPEDVSLENGHFESDPENCLTTGDADHDGSIEMLEQLSCNKSQSEFITT
ncbi:Ulp1 protease family protein [Nitzschia inconspicua]|uniref:Ulp1 protease family protein n=1 Tax=Nitzschia inconspicua TaxID=303405 RepID=A0A9K3Q1K2_9STRA|nr:Ulp1 protease family protein [Nitzschia inconspicua]